jgi:hypothetical protein
MCSIARRPSAWWCRPAAQVVDGQPQARMTLGDPADVRSESVASMAIGTPARSARPTTSRACHRPASSASAPEETIAQAEHARLAPPRIDEGALVRLIQREGAEDREAAGKSRTALNAISAELGSQPGGWITARRRRPRPSAQRLLGVNEVTWRWAMLLGKPLPQRWI